MNGKYRPPYTISPVIVRHIAEISELVGRYTVSGDTPLTPRLRHGNRLRTIQASLAIENNSLTLEQVTAVLSGKRVLGSPREIQEVRNAFVAYERLDSWEPAQRRDLLAAHRVLMAGLVDRPGAYRSGAVGIFRGKRVVHMAPPASRVGILMDDLLGWLKNTDEHPLVASSLFHYEFEFIHPFADGNGRMGRLWQTLILSKWKPLMAYLPVETVIHDRQQQYYRVLAQADRGGDATPFAEFILESLRTALVEAVTSDQVTDQVTDQVARLLAILADGEMVSTDLMAKLGLSHRPTFRKNYLESALTAELIERTLPKSPRSPTQRYRLTDKGRAMLARQKF